MYPVFNLFAALTLATLSAQPRPASAQALTRSEVVQIRRRRVARLDEKIFGHQPLLSPVPRCPGRLGGRSKPPI